MFLANYKDTRITLTKVGLVSFCRRLGTSFLGYSQNIILFNPNKAGFEDISFYWGVNLTSPFHISRTTNSISV